MNKNVQWRLLISLAVLVVFAAVGVYPIVGSQRGITSPSWLMDKQLKLGLDLKGGVHLVLRVQTDDALRLQDAGCFSLVLEGIPGDLAAKVTESLAIPTIGIGAGPDTDAQVIVWQDLVGLTPGPAPKFVKQYADVRTVIADAVGQWGADVASGAYPAPEHAYS